MSLKELRVNAGLTQAQVASAVGVTQAAVAEWEAGRCMPESSRLTRLAAALGCTVDSLLQSPDSHPTPSGAQPDTEPNGAEVTP